MAPKKETVLKLTAMRYKVATCSEEKFSDYATHDHAPKAAVVQQRHGALRIAQYHTPKVMRDAVKEKLPWLVRPGWEIDDHDIQIQVYVRTTDQLLAILSDPDFQALMAEEDAGDLQDPSKATICAGWEEVYVDNNEIVNIEDGKSLYGTYQERVSSGDGIHSSDLQVEKF